MATPKPAPSPGPALARMAGPALATAGIRHVFGTADTGDGHPGPALAAVGVRFVPAAGGGGAIGMADGYAVASGRVGVAWLGTETDLTSALTAIAMATRAGVPLLVIAPDTGPGSTGVDFGGLAAGVGANHRRPGTAADLYQEIAAGCDRIGRDRPVVLIGPPAPPATVAPPTTVAPPPTAVAPPPTTVAPPPTTVAPPPGPPVAAGTLPAVPRPQTDALIAALLAARRPVFIAGCDAARGIPAARTALGRLANRCGALLAVAAGAKGLFTGDPWCLEIVDEPATPLAAELVGQADLVVAWGGGLGDRPGGAGALIAPGTTVVRVDRQPVPARSRTHVQLRVPGDVATIASTVDAALRRRGDWRGPGWRTPDLRRRIAAEGRWRDIHDGQSTARAATIALDDLLPTARTVAVDAGVLGRYPSMFLSVPDAASWRHLDTTASCGPGLSIALGASLARPGKLAVAALDAAGFLAAAPDLAAAVRLERPVLAIVYDDGTAPAYGRTAVPAGRDVDAAGGRNRWIAATARGLGAQAFAASDPTELAPLGAWLLGPRRRPLVIQLVIGVGPAG